MESKLTAKQRAFCLEYLVDLNATKAAVRAGYSERRAGQTGFEILEMDSAKAEIARLTTEREQRTEIKADAVLKELAVTAFFDPAVIGAAGITGPADIEKLPETVRRCIAGWSWDKAGNFTPKFSDKLRALEMVGRHLGMFRDQVEHSGPFGGPIPIAATSLSPEQIAQVERIAKRRETLAQEQGLPR